MNDSSALVCGRGGDLHLICRASPQDAAGDIGADLDLAVALLADNPPKNTLGFTKQGPASTAYVRKCLEVKRKDAKILDLQQKLEELTARRLCQSSCCEPPLLIGTGRGGHLPSGKSGFTSVPSRATGRAMEMSIRPEGHSDFFRPPSSSWVGRRAVGRAEPSPTPPPSNGAGLGRGERALSNVVGPGSTQQRQCA